MRSSLLLATAALLSALPGVALAQSIDSLTNTDPFTLSVQPLYPAPGNSVLISALSANIDLNNALMDVSVAGKNIYHGSVRAVSVPLGAAGVLTTATVVITDGDTKYTKTVSVRPEDVALIVEPRATTPPLYPGKPAEPLNGNVRVVALASFRDGSGKAIDPTTLSYSWTVDDAQQANSSGIGKNTLMVMMPLQYRGRSVSVVVQSLNGAFTSGTTLSLIPQEPTVRIYENDPLLGIRYDHALSNNYTIAGAEATLYAAPFSFPTLGGTPLLTWFLNGTRAQQGNSITLRPTGSGQGSASLSLVADSGDTAQATANLSLIFGATAKTNFFGL